MDCEVSLCLEGVRCQSCCHSQCEGESLQHRRHFVHSHCQSINNCQKLSNYLDKIKCRLMGANFTNCVYLISTNIDYTNVNKRKERKGLISMSKSGLNNYKLHNINKMKARRAHAYKLSLFITQLSDILHNQSPQKFSHLHACS